MNEKQIYKRSSVVLGVLASVLTLAVTLWLLISHKGVILTIGTLAMVLVAIVIGVVVQLSVQTALQSREELFNNNKRQ